MRIWHYWPFKSFWCGYCFYNPTGQLDLEKHLQEDSYDVHRLEHMLFDLHYEEPKPQKTAPDKIIKTL